MQVEEVADPTPAQQSRQAIEDISPSAAVGATPRRLTFKWTMPDGTPIDKEYWQEELGMFPTQEFGTMLTEALNSFTEGELGEKIGELFRGDVKMPVTMDSDTVSAAIQENMALIKAFVKLVQMLPDFQQEVMVLSLGVPRLERQWAKQQLAEPPRRGGLTVEEGFDILIVFIRQNAELLKDTVRGKAEELVDTFRLEVLGQEKETSSSSTESEEISMATMETPLVSTSPGGTPLSTSSPDTPESD